MLEYVKNTNLVGFLFLILFTACNSNKDLSGTYCLEEIGVESCLSNYEITDHSDTTKFIIKGKVLNILDSLPIRTEVDIYEKGNLSNYKHVDKDGNFYLEISNIEKSTIMISSMFYGSYKQELTVVLGKELELLIYLGQSHRDSMIRTDNIRRLKKSIKKENRFRKKWNEQIRIIHEKVIDNLNKELILL